MHTWRKGLSSANCIVQSQQELDTAESSHHGVNGSVSQSHRSQSHSPEPVATPSVQVQQQEHIVLYYHTGWNHANLHYSFNAGDWQDLAFQQVGCSCMYCRAVYILQFMLICSCCPVVDAGQLI